jgi:hypothetical protein
MSATSLRAARFLHATTYSRRVNGGRMRAARSAVEVLALDAIEVKNVIRAKGTTRAVERSLPR